MRRLALLGCAVAASMATSEPVSSSSTQSSLEHSVHLSSGEVADVRFVVGIRSSDLAEFTSSTFSASLVASSAHDDFDIVVDLLGYSGMDQTQLIPAQGVAIGDVGVADAFADCAPQGEFCYASWDFTLDHIGGADEVLVTLSVYATAQAPDLDIVLEVL